MYTVLLRAMDRKTKQRLTLNLIDVLKSLASYNDKGVVWMKHTAAEIEENRQQYADRLSRLRNAMVPANLTEEAHAFFDSPDLLKDPTHGHLQQLRNLIKEYRFYIDY
ncbi:MAG: hypothetical protein AAF564_14005 [Bacteroidota bacterium]